MPLRTLRMVKPEIRILGVDDGQFVPHSRSKVHVIGLVFRGRDWVEGSMSTRITVDGFDATQNIADMVMASPHYRQIRVIMLNGITFAGFNVVDIKELSARTDVPVIAVTSKKPNLTEVQAALMHLPDSEKRWEAVLNAGELFSVSTNRGKRRIFVEAVGLSKSLAVEILRLTSTRSKIPEPLRVAHIVASGISQAL